MSILGVLSLGEHVHYSRNGKEHKGRIISLSTCTCGLAGVVDCKCGSKVYADHVIPLAAERFSEILPEGVFCLIKS
jgi:hypothetical protein